MSRRHCAPPFTATCIEPVRPPAIPTWASCVRYSMYSSSPQKSSEGNIAKSSESSTFLWNSWKVRSSSSRVICPVLTDCPSIRSLMACAKETPHSRVVVATLVGSVSSYSSARLFSLFTFFALSACNSVITGPIAFTNMSWILFSMKEAKFWKPMVFICLTSTPFSLMVAKSCLCFSSRSVTKEAGGAVPSCQNGSVSANLSRLAGKSPKPSTH
mmetsp:Transcript_22087/g.61900  ORF Transcript_22087/g.61900 Transcript_22087/m.61900 type:complete len:214 (+) Transcript_22087:963-1604(+)